MQRILPSTATRGDFSHALRATADSINPAPEDITRAAHLTSQAIYAGFLTPEQDQSITEQWIGEVRLGAADLAFARYLASCADIIDANGDGTDAQQNLTLDSSTELQRHLISAFRMNAATVFAHKRMTERNLMSSVGACAMMVMEGVASQEEVDEVFDRIKREFPLPSAESFARFQERLAELVASKSLPPRPGTIDGPVDDPGKPQDKYPQKTAGLNPIADAVARRMFGGNTRGNHAA